ncbi:HAD family hydrolase [Pediococcus ethanolidurans]|uniref:Cof-type HAD-IIB family hydrolase n=1 Tax=Pediococcus ethanolidurans TaxID=319653 RepID=UPI001C1EE44C|nr:Cof-type HAD-IIB family hydrolase [Pediococcus ethanolidurans]MBU7562848.1 HAD family hydrolase [Pediococcus ethanolidurans]MCT4399068.1 HAD family hydrolase [Pediococcus ethanolidurans]
MIKLVSTDMDGTFLRDNMSYDEEKFAALQKQFHKQGIRFVVASGNQYFQLKSFFKAYADTIYVAENGAYIRDQKQIYALHSFAPTTVDHILNDLALIPDLKIIVCGEKSAYILASEDPAYITKMRQFYYHLDTVADFSKIDDHIVKFAVGCPPEKTDELVKQLKSLLSGLAEPTSSGHGDIDLIQPGINKAAGLKELGNILGIELSEMCAFGDGGNDLEMIRETGLGIAMQNAQPAVKAVANDQTTDNQHQGVLVYLEQLLKTQK